MSEYYLENRLVLEAKGKDAATFLQGIITNDVYNLNNENILYSLVLTPQGKFLFEIFIYLVGSSYLIDCDADKAKELELYLKKYKLRSAVDIKIREDLGVFYSIEKTSELKLDPRFEKIGFRGVKPIKGDVKGGYLEYRNNLLQNAVPDPHNIMEEGRSFPLNFNLHQLHAVSFNKGCYIGQELTARMKHRGMIRKKIVKVTTKSSSILEGKDINFNGKNIGEILDCNEIGDGIAQINIESFEKNVNDINCKVSDVEVVLNKAPWDKD